MFASPLPRTVCYIMTLGVVDSARRYGERYIHTYIHIYIYATS
jgi:hypothetical protein